MRILLDSDNARRFLYLDALTPCLNKATVARIANESGIVLHKGNKWTAPTISLVRKSFTAEWYDDDEWTLLPDRRHNLCQEAMQDASLCQTISRILNDMRHQGSAVLENLAYLAIYRVPGINIPTSVTSLEFQSVASMFLADAPFSESWLLSREEAHRRIIATTACWDLLFYTRVWAACALCIREFERCSTEDPELAGLRSELALWRNEPCPRTAAEGDRERAHLFAGMAATLQGRYDEALSVLAQTAGPYGVLFETETPDICLQLARLATATGLEQTGFGKTDAFRNAVHHTDSIAYRALLKLYCLRYSNRCQMKNVISGPCHGAFPFDSCILGTILQFLVAMDKIRPAWIAGCVTLYRILEPILPVASAILRDMLRATGETVSPSEVDAIPHADFSPLIQKADGAWYWQEKFEELLNFLGEGKKKQAPQKPQRLAWFLDTRSGEAIPKIQKQQANGGWTGGKRLAAKRLILEADTLEFLSPQDRKIAAAYTLFATYYGSGSSYCFIPEKGLPLLVGHPLLFLEGTGQPITLRLEPVQLLVREKNSHCTLKLSAVSEYGERYALYEKSHGAWVLTIFSKQQEDFQRILGKDGLTIPREKLPRLVDAMRDSSSETAIQMNVQARRQAGDARPVLQLRLRGLQVEGQLCVRPAISANVQPPGEGPENLLASVDGEIVRIERSFSEEIANAQKLIAACPALGRCLEGWQWYGDSLEDAFEMMTDLALHKDECTVEWPEGQKFRLAGEISRSSVNIHAERKGNDWFSLSGKVNVSESRVIELAELLEKLADSSGRFVRLSDDEFLALTTDVKRALERLRLMSSRKKNGERSINPLASPALDDVCKGMELETDTHWADTIARMREAFSIEPETPGSLQADLRPYQTEGFIWLSRLAHWGVGACLADDMGLGKTVQTIAVMLREAHRGPCLVVAPTSVCANWEMEIARFAPGLAVHRLREQGERRQTVANMGPGMVLVVGYGLLHKEANLLAKCHWHVVVFDEAQALKNSATKRSKAAASLTADFHLALTGTPIENHLEDLWSIFNIINPGLLGTLTDYRRRFAAAGAGGAAGTTLKMLVRPFILRRLKSQVLDDLPSRTEQTIVIEPSEKEKVFYEALRRRAVDNLSGKDATNAGTRRLNILTELTRLRRACCHASLVEPEAATHVDARSSKIEAFLHLLDEARAGGHRLLVFSQFVGMLSLVRQELDKAGIAYQYLDGATPEEQRRKGVAAFQSGQGDCFLISLKAGGQGLNLSAADYVVHLDPWWNPAVEDQATDRAHRIGQHRPVTVYRLVMANSVEEKILALHAKKRELAADFLEGAETANIIALSEEELLRLLG